MNYWAKFSYLVMILFVIKTIEESASKQIVPYKIDLQKMVVKVRNESVCLTVIAKILPQRKRQPQLTVLCNLSEPLNEIWATAELFYKFKRYEPFMMKGRVEVCKWMKGEAFNAVFDLLYGMFSKYNLFHKCPYEGIEGITNFTFDSSTTPAYLPSGKYRIDFLLQTADATPAFFYLQIFIEIKPVGAADIAFV